MYLFLIIIKMEAQPIELASEGEKDEQLIKGSIKSEGEKVEQLIKGSIKPEGEKDEQLIKGSIDANIDDLNNNDKTPKKKLILIIIGPIFLVLMIVMIIFLVRKDNNNNNDNDKDLIDNSNIENEGVVKLVNELNNDVIIKKELLKSIKSFIASLGGPGSGKSTFASNYYKLLYRVKNDYFNSSNSEISVTKEIWMITEKERGKIPSYINKDMLDVKGYESDDIKSLKYVMIVTFLSTDIVILHRDPRYDNVKKIIKNIENALKKMKQLDIPTILKNIYIQKKDTEKTIEELLEQFEYDKDIFKEINFEYIFLPEVKNSKEKQDLLEDSEYKKNFEKIVNKLNKKDVYNSVSSLMNYIDNFNNVINGKDAFEKEKLFRDIEIDFNGVYNKYETKLKNILYEKIPYLKKLDNLNETFEDFINKQTNLNLTFEIRNEDFTFYRDNYIYFYEELKKNKSFKIDPKEIFNDFYNKERNRLEGELDKKKQIIIDELNKKEKAINNYFSLLKFYQEIDDRKLDLKINVDTDQIKFKEEKENELINYFYKKIKEKEKEWEDQIQRAKWKLPVQARGEMKCVNGHKFDNDLVLCGECKKGYLYWVDSDEKYTICESCNNIHKISGELVCSRCGGKAKSTVKWVEGFKP